MVDNVLCKHTMFNGKTLRNLLTLKALAATNVFSQSNPFKPYMHCFTQAKRYCISLGIAHLLAEVN